MKKRIFALLVAAIMIVSVLALSSCDLMSMLPDSITSLIPGMGSNGDQICDTHTDADGDEICDSCGASVPAQKPNTPGEELPEEPDRDPTYKITFNFYGTIYENKVVTDPESDNFGATILDSTGKPERISAEKAVSVYTLDVLEEQAPTAEQLAEISGITYGGITVVGWYDSPALEKEFDFTKPLTGDVDVYAKLKISEKDKKGNGYCGDNATWKLTSAGVLEIEGKGAMYDFTYPELAPWYFNEKGEKNIINGVEVGKNITHVGAYSFYNLGISDAKAIDLGNGVTSIGAYAFAYSTVLKSLPLTDNIEIIGNGAFEGCRAFSTIVIPDSVKIIEGYAFANCTKFDSIVLGTGLERIGENAFNQGSGDAHQYIYYRGTAEQYENVIVQMGNNKFSSFGAYLYFYVEADSAEAKTAGQYWTYNAYGAPMALSYTIRYYEGGGKNKFPIFTDFVLIEADKTATYTEANKAAMEAIVYRGYKFESWSGLDKYLNGSKITGHIDVVGNRGALIGDNATYHYDPVTQILTIKGTGTTWDFEGAGDTLYFSQLITKIVFEDGITGLGANVLSGITSIITIELPDTITSVHPKTFAGCTKLAAVYYMGDSLDDCTGLDSLVETNAKAYAKASGNVAGKEGAFWQDSDIKKCVICDGDGKIIEKDPSDQSIKEVDCKACDGKGERVYRLAWSFKDGVLTIAGDDVMPNFDKGEAPWLAYDNVKEITFASNVKAIGENAFAGLKSVEKITLHNKLVTIPRSAFEGSAYWNNDANWQNGALMANAHLLAFDASKMNAGATFATIPQATKIIAADAFKDCGKITALVLPAYIDSIDETAFDGLKALKTIYYYGQNVNAWNTLTEAARNDLIGNGAKLLYRAGSKPASNAADFWRMVKGVPTTWDK